MDKDIAFLIADILDRVVEITGKYLEDDEAFTEQQREIMEKAIGISIDHRYPLIDKLGS